MSAPHEELFDLLQSADIATRVTAIERASHEPEKYAESVVALIPRFPNEAYFVLERVGRFGNAIIPHLAALEASSKDKELRLYAILGLAHFNCEVDCAPLLEAIHTRSDWEALACMALVHLWKPEFLPDLLKELRTTLPDKDWNRVETLIRTIEELGGEIPTSEMDRLSALATPFQRMMLFTKPG